MRLPQTSRVAREHRLSDLEEFEISAMAIQLDAFFTFLVASPVACDEAFAFCQLLFNTVAGPGALDVRDQLIHYSEIRQSTEAGEGVSEILLAASRRLHPDWSWDRADPLRSAKYVLAVLELVRQGMVAAENWAIPLPPKEDWHPVCAEIVRFFEQGRRIEAEKLKSLCPL
ncbi:hypothetical protein HQ563_05515 [bacterium]|nr:hypothetical protein [bacterium]